MSRWNISHVVYYSQHGQNRLLEFEPENVTIITGASRTGKTYIIETIDYCLCSSSIALSNLIKKKLSFVGIKLIKGSTEILIVREISQKSSNASSKMFLEIGNDIEIPENSKDLKGKINSTQAKQLLSERFGLINFKDYQKDESSKINSISIRQLTPYLFLDKEVIDSRKNLLHGLDDVNSAKHIIPSLPYFLNAIDLEELQALKKLKGLKRGIETEEKKKSTFEQFKKQSIESLKMLFNEVVQVGLLKKEEFVDDVNSIKNTLKGVLNWQPNKIIFENEKLLYELQSSKSSILSEINRLKRKRTLAIQNQSSSSKFKTVTKKQASKLNVIDLFNLERSNCPICDSHLEKTSDIISQIEKSFDILKKESVVVDEYKPKLDGYIIELDELIQKKTKEASKLESQIQNLIKESSIATKQKNNNDMILRTIGRVSYYLDNFKEAEEFDSSRLTRYKEEFDAINENYSIEQRQKRIEEAETFISNNATKNLAYLPIDEHYKDDSIKFTSKKPTIELYNNDSGAIESFSSIGSDENYLSIHLALIFAFHKFFEIKKSPVPGLIILDQVSRPYYPKDQIDQDIIIDEDREALNKHFDFIFDQVEKQNGLQVIVLEHAYLHKNERYKKATKYRWPRDGEERLIPQDWPDIE
ncbi:DUF3732 domain-containing protein [uncultured Kordia sp.]|uniref:DUF3732 domain-containing protein n=1 Tax=uncultured Kordia sp. TaxID=507699 RepID=UPI002627301E|nr:DUF3732 domain-containing protein [uncultured Kordia sp.]